ncbi:UNVERIFIED_CONTAM: putative pentatricopeptide repeat-containing protein [Sesamum latifolium]|uniref:Pentatricopeptide repeat-containing protein n=1 Tax=Sesamum latifolium TaxID=2727402 RepID=A0AAW2WAM9_9LAMI
MEKYGLTANIKHYGCLVDLLGRAGKLQDAFNLVKEMPMAPNDRVLGALLGACRIHSDTFMAENVLELVSKLNSYRVSHDDTHYLLLSNIYAASERWEMAEGMRVVFSARGSKKIPGHSALMF